MRVMRSPSWRRSTPQSPSPTLSSARSSAPAPIATAPIATAVTQSFPSATPSACSACGTSQSVPLPDHGARRESGVCSGPQRGRESSSQLGSIVDSRGRLGRHAEVFDGTAEESQHCRHASAEAIAPDSPVAGLGAPPDRPVPLGPDGVPPASRDSVDVPVRRPRSGSKAIVVRVSPTAFSAWSGVTTQATKDTTAMATANTTGRRRRTRGGDQFDPTLTDLRPVAAKVETAGD